MTEHLLGKEKVYVKPHYQNGVYIEGFYRNVEKKLESDEENETTVGKVTNPIEQESETTQQNFDQSKIIAINFDLIHANIEKFKQIIENLKSNGYLINIITDKDENSVVKFLNVNGIMFDIMNEDVGRSYYEIKGEDIDFEDVDFCSDKKHTPLVSEAQRRLFGAVASGKQTEADGLSKKTAEQHLKESKGKDLPEKIKASDENTINLDEMLDKLLQKGMSRKEAIEYLIKNNEITEEQVTDNNRVIKQKNGLNTIRNVIIFTECEKDGYKFGPKEIRDYVGFLQSREKDGYRIGVHFHHTKRDEATNPDVQGIGQFANSRLTVIDMTKKAGDTLQRQKVNAIIGDYININNENLGPILEDKFPNVSPEFTIADGVPEIKSVALLPIEEAPHNKIANLKSDNIKFSDVVLCFDENLIMFDGEFDRTRAKKDEPQKSKISQLLVQGVKWLAKKLFGDKKEPKEPGEKSWTEHYKEKVGKIQKRYEGDENIPPIPKPGEEGYKNEPRLKQEELDLTPEEKEKIVSERFPHIAGFEYNSRNDDRVRIPHQAVHKLRLSVNSPKWKQLNAIPLLGHNCRCRLLPITWNRAKNDNLIDDENNFSEYVPPEAEKTANERPDKDYPLGNLEEWGATPLHFADETDFETLPTYKFYNERARFLTDETAKLDEFERELWLTIFIYCVSVGDISFSEIAIKTNYIYNFLDKIVCSNDEETKFEIEIQQKHKKSYKDMYKMDFDLSQMNFATEIYQTEDNSNPLFINTGIARGNVFDGSKIIKLYKQLSKKYEKNISWLAILMDWLPIANESCYYGLETFDWFFGIFSGLSYKNVLTNLWSFLELVVVATTMYELYDKLGRSKIWH
jgi:hypothetical protein